MEWWWDEMSFADIIAAMQEAGMVASQTEEPVPDGWIEVIYFGEHPNESYYFSQMKDWFWWNAKHEPEPHHPDILVIRDINGEQRYEIPACNVRKVIVHYNTPPVVEAMKAWRDT
jgi:hypothetical protein